MADGKENDGLYDGAIGWGIMLVIIAVLLWLFWYYFDTEIRDAVRWVRYGEMWVIGSILQLGAYLGLYEGGYEVFVNGKYYSWEEGLRATSQFSAQELTNMHLSYFAALAMQPLKIPFMVLLLLAALWAVFKGPKTYYRSKLGLEGLIDRQSKVFPVISPFIDFNPSEQKPRAPGSPVPAELPPFSEALGPEEWLAYNEVKVPDGKVDEEAARQAFIKQLGPRWRGAAHLQPYQQILLAAFILKANRKREQSDIMLGDWRGAGVSKAGLN